MKLNWQLILKGFGVGASMLIPGISGGSTAIILGIYDQLIHAVAGFRLDVRQNIFFLTLFSVGGIIGMLAAARPLLLLFTHYQAPALYFFSGAAAGSIPMLIAKSRVQRFKPQLLLWPLLGVAIVLIPNVFNQPPFQQAAAAPGAWFLLIAGLASAAAFVLPGISVSYIWLLLGMYDATMRAIGQVQIFYLLPLTLGLLLGIILCARLLQRAMRRWPGATYLSILGFLLGSLIQVFPGLPTGAQWLTCPFLFALGLYAVIWLGRTSA